MDGKRKITIGRAVTNDIVINHETVSRNHAEMTVDGERIVITDFSSKNGTFVIRNNNRVQIKMAELTINDTLAFGNVVMQVRELLRMSSKQSTDTTSYKIGDIRPPKIPSIPKYQHPSPSSHNNIQETTDFEYAGFWIRTGAYLVDTILISIITWPLILLIYGRAYFDNKDDKIFMGFADFVISFVFPVVAVILFWIYKQATPGKIALSLKIVDAKTGGAPSVLQCIARYFAYILSALPLCLGFIWVAFDSKKQGWHDKLVGTLVIKYKKKPVRFE